MYLASLASLIIVLTAVCCIAGRLRRGTRTGYRSSLAIMIAAVFTGLIILGMPLSYSEYREAYPDAGGLWISAAALLQCIQNAMRTFVLDGSWDELLTRSAEGSQIPMLATVVGLSLDVIAPVLTFSAILSLFKEITSKIRARVMASSRDTLFLFSELNKDTVFLAEDIRKNYPKAKLIYTDVYPEEDESNYELREKAGRLHAVMLRTDISEFDIKDRKAPTEYFLFGHDEEENVMQAKKLFLKNKSRGNTGIYVKAVQKGNALYIDSLTSSLDLCEDVEKAENEKWDYEMMKTAIREGGILKLRRIDPEKQIAWREIPRIQSIRDAFALPYDSEKKILSVMVFADTHLSFSMIKTLLWYCQSDRFMLELNIVYTDGPLIPDEDRNGKGENKVNVRRLLEFECPDIIKTDAQLIPGDAFYDIEFISSDEIESGDFQKQMISLVSDNSSGSALIRRLRKTDVVIIDRGNDGASIETAAFLRITFERMDAKPEIYAVCSDEEDFLKDINANNGIVNYNDESYEIRIIGKRSDTYTYNNIKNEDEENLGYCQHIKWVDVENSKEGLEDRESTLKKELLDFERHEYFRDSSVSKAMYLRNVLADPDKELSEEETEKAIAESAIADRLIDDNTRFEWRLRFRPEYECVNDPAVPSDRWSCTCEKCMTRRQLEHERWNAFMRTEGYITSKYEKTGEKLPLAKIHGNMVSFFELTENDREKNG